jgi:transposase-like protein
LEVLRTAVPIRQCIFKFVSEDDEFLSGEVEMDESYFGGRRKVKRGSIIYTDKFKAYYGLVGKFY